MEPPGVAREEVCVGLGPFGGAPARAGPDAQGLILQAATKPRMAGPQDVVGVGACGVPRLRTRCRPS